MSTNTAELYDALAGDYHLVYGDWHASIVRQADALQRVMDARLGEGRKRILDCSCGIGTQSLGLARLGHSVFGVDLSSGAVERARHEAQAAGLSIEFAVGDLRNLEAMTTATFDVVLSADNSIAHLLDEADLRRGVRSMLARLRPGGLLALSIRDYDALLGHRPVSTPPTISGHPGNRRVTFQLWEWLPDGRTYDFEIFVVSEADGGTWRTRSLRGRSRAWQRSEVSRILEGEGVAPIEWPMPADSGFFQPLAVASRS